MPNIDKHPPGSFCWIGLATTDQKAAKGFYGSLFGWAVNDFAVGPNEFITFFKLDGRDVGEAYTLRAEQRSQGAPPHWMIYIAVESADAAASKAGQLGGKVLAPPFDIFDAARVAVVQDPSGAVFSLWQAKKQIGTGLAGVEGTLCWADLMTPDPARAQEFYSGLFAWKLVAGEKDPSGYLHIKNGEAFIGGVPPKKQSDPRVPPHWLPYFMVSDCDAATAKARQLGAKIHLAPMTMEDVGRWAVVRDPQGAVFAIFQSAHRH